MRRKSGFAPLLAISALSPTHTFACGEGGEGGAEGDAKWLSNRGAAVAADKAAALDKFVAGSDATAPSTPTSSA
ncbi:hypothetical protein LKMONMHP_0077 [Methylobacterium organophilum]|uniref:Uncharacterized protein n=1 Tax=Methylobacterium organophilum TaxID=410 RepID=A0ABQ4T2V1_METOR|nr:hypothetical protein LKMONMHP_0077 [Methylobacterium organophilum]